VVIDVHVSPVMHKYLIMLHDCLCLINYKVTVQISSATPDLLLIQ